LPSGSRPTTGPWTVTSAARPRWRAAMSAWLSGLAGWQPLSSAALARMLPANSSLQAGGRHDGCLPPVVLGLCDGAGTGLHLAVAAAGGITPALAPRGSDAWRARRCASRPYTSAGWARSELATAVLGVRGLECLGLAV